MAKVKEEGKVKSEKVRKIRLWRYGVILGGLWGLVSSIITLEKHFTCAIVREMNLFQYFSNSHFSLIEIFIFFPAFIADKYSCWGWTLTLLIYVFFSILIGVIIGLVISYGYNNRRRKK